MRITLVATCFFLSLAAGPAQGAEFHAGLQSAPHAGSPRAAAEAYLRAEARRFDLASVDLVHLASLDLGELRTVRFTQLHEGLPVLGTGVALRLAPDGRVTAAALEVGRDLRVSPTPALDQARVRELLAQQVDARLAVARLAFRLAVLPDRGGGRLVWQVGVAAGTRSWEYLVDAHDGELLGDRPLMIHALGRVYALDNTTTTSDQELPSVDALTPQVLTGFGGQLKVVNYVSGGVTTDYVFEQTLQPNSGADFLYDPPANEGDTTDGFAQVMVYYHLARARAFYATTMGVDFSASSWSLLGVANLTEEGTPYDNAGTIPGYPIGAPWNVNNMIVVGQGSMTDFAIDADVMLHEFTHYVSANALNYANSYGSNEYGRSPFSGAIDEGLSDYMACTINGNSTLGELSLAPFGMARDLTVSTKRCPTDMNGEVHDDGEIIGSLSWTLRDAFGKETGDKLVWGAVKLLVPNATFGDYGQALLQTANDLVAASVLQAGDVETITAALAARGLDQCFAEIPIEADTPSKVGVRGLTFYGLQRGRTCEEMKVDRDGNPRFRQTLFHYATTTEATDAGIRFKVAFAGDPAALNWKVYARKGQHVGFSSTGGYQTTLTDFDWVSDPTTATSGELVIDATSTPPFEAGQSYHFLVTYQNCPDEVMTVEYERLQPVQEDAGAPQQDAAPGDDAGGGGGDQKGCGCRAAGAADAGGPVLLLLGLFLLRRRRA